jgi:hypothetical protein
MNAPSPSIEAAPVVDIFTGISFEIEEIILGRNVLDTKLRSMLTARDGKDIVALKVAAEEIAKITGQMEMLSAHLAKILQHHANRKPRVES